MARIGENAFRQYRDGQDRLTAPEYMAERELIRLAVNDLDDKVQRTEGIREEFINTVNEVETVKGEVIQTKQEVETKIEEFTQVIGSTAQQAQQAKEEAQQAKEEVAQVGVQVNDKASKTEVQEVSNQLVNVANKTDGVISVKDTLFGAVGDGVTDDTLAIQSAIDFAIASNQSLVIPKGKYNIKELSIITNKDTSLAIYGVDREESILYYTGNGTAITVDNTVWGKWNYLHFHDFSLNAPTVITKASRTALKGIALSRTVHSKFERLGIRYFKEDGMYLVAREDDNPAGNSVWNNHFSDVKFLRCGNGFNIKGCISDSHFSLCTFEYMDDCGFYFNSHPKPYRGSWNTTFINNTVIYSRKAMFFDNVIYRNVIISGSNFEQFSESGIHIIGDSVDKSSLFSIHNNLFFSQNLGTEEGIVAQNTGGLNVHTNSFYNKALTDIRFDSTALTGHVYNNTAFNRPIVVNVGKTVNYYQFEWVLNQDTTRFNTGLMSASGDFITNTTGRGFVTKSPDGAYWRISVNNDGTFKSTKIV